jgi:hypothetical protein
VLYEDSTLNATLRQSATFAVRHLPFAIYHSPVLPFSPLPRFYRFPYIRHHLSIQAVQLEIYQWLGPLIAVLFIYRTIRQYQLHHRSLRGTIIWISFWVVLIVLAVLPDTLSQRIAAALGFKSNINAVIFTGMGFLFLIVFYLSDALHNMERKVTELVRELAIERARTGSEKSSPEKPAEAKSS